MGMYTHILIDLVMCTQLCTSSRDRSCKEVDCRKTTWMFVHRLVLKPSLVGKIPFACEPDAAVLPSDHAP